MSLSLAVVNISKESGVDRMALDARQDRSVFPLTGLRKGEETGCGTMSLPALRDRAQKCLFRDNRIAAALSQSVRMREGMREGILKIIVSLTASLILIFWAKNENVSCSF